MPMHHETHKPTIGAAQGIEVVIRYDPSSTIVSYRASVTVPWHKLRKTVYYGVYVTWDGDATTRSLAEKLTREYLQKEKLNELSDGK